MRDVVDERCGKLMWAVWSGCGQCGEAWGDVGQCGVDVGNVGQYGEMKGSVEWM